MANYIVSYDLNGPRPSHKEMDDHLEKIGVARGRILETVWYVGYSGTKKQLLDHVKSILGKEDLLIVVEAKSATWTKLLVDEKSLVTAWAAESAITVTRLNNATANFRELARLLMDATEFVNGGAGAKPPEECLKLLNELPSQADFQKPAPIPSEQRPPPQSSQA